MRLSGRTLVSYVDVDGVQFRDVSISDLHAKYSVAFDTWHYLHLFRENYRQFEHDCVMIDMFEIFDEAAYEVMREKMVKETPYLGKELRVWQSQVKSQL